MNKLKTRLIIQKIIFIIISFAITATAQNIAFFDDFESGIGNWEITNDGGACVWEVWDINNNSYTLPSTAQGNILVADSDICGSGTTLLSTATLLNSLDLSQYPNMWIEFDHDFRTIGPDDDAIVEVSLDGGASWSEVISWHGNDARNKHHVSPLLNTNLSNDVRFRLISIQPGWDWWWAIDNFIVYGIDWGYTPPNAPSDLVAIANSPGQVLLNWQDNSNDESEFDIQRKLGDSLSTNQYLWLDFTGENITTYVDTTVLDTTLYTYRIFAYKFPDGWSDPSNQAEVLTLIPVELISFEGNIIDGNVLLKWSTATETNNSGFEIHRTNQNEGQNWKKICFVQGHGTTTEPQSYSFTDESILSGIYQYRLKQIDYDGSYEYSNIIAVEVGIPTEFSLEQNYPNPFNPTTIIRFSIPAVETGHAPSLQLIVYDVLGNEVATLINEEKEAGIYEVEFDATGITSGIYFYKLQAGNFVETKKMLMIK